MSDTSKKAIAILSCEELHRTASQLFLDSGLDINIDPKKCSLLESKKHYVFKTNLLSSNRTVCIKMFNESIANYHQRWENELQNIAFLSQISYMFNVPEIIASAKNVIIYEFLEGINLFDLLLGKNLASETLRSLAEKFAILHDHGFIYGDARLRNMILVDGSKLYFIDTEEMRRGESLEDLQELLCSFIDSTPGIFQKHLDLYCLNKMFQFLRYYLSFSPIRLPQDAYAINPNHRHFWIQEIKQALVQIAQRRLLDLSDGDWAEIEEILLSSMKKN